MRTFWLESTIGDNQYIWEEHAAKKLVLRAYKSADSDWVQTDAGLHQKLNLENNLDSIKANQMTLLSKDEVFLELL